MPTRAIIELLGVFRLTDEDGVVVPVPQAQQRIVLAMLASAEEQGVTSDGLLGALWPQELPRSARKTLHGYIARLRRLLGADSILTRPGGYVLNLERYEVDVRLARACIDAGRRSADPDERLRLFTRALDLFRGEPLEDVPSEALHQAHAQVLGDLRLLALEYWAREQIRADPAAAVGPLREASAERPHQESLWALFVEALTASGRRAEALDCYRRARRLLLDDLGIEPGPALRQAQENALAAHPEPRSEADEGPVGPETLITASLARRRAEGAAIAVVGPPGIGKSWAANAVVHEVRRSSAAERPPVTVHARTAEQDDRSAREIAVRVLGAWGVEPGGEPLDDLRAEWARSPALVVLDDVTHPAQYEGLLPVPPGGGLIVCTTMSRPAGRQVEVFELRPYPLEQVLDLLVRTRAQPSTGLAESAVRVFDAVLEGLPAAVHALVERITDEPDLTWDEIVARLRDPRRRLDLLTSRSIDVRARLRAPYGRLQDSARRAFRLLGWLDAHSFTDTVASAALDLPGSETRGLLAELVRSGLVRADFRGNERRYRIPQLARSLAREISDYTDDRTLRDAAVRRALRAWQSNPFALPAPPTASQPWGESRGTRPLMLP